LGKNQMVKVASRPRCHETTKFYFAALLTVDSLKKDEVIAKPYKLALLSYFALTETGLAPFRRLVISSRKSRYKNRGSGSTKVTSRLQQ